MKQELTAHALIQSFITGLGDFLETLAPTRTKQTRALCFESGVAAGSATFKPDRNYYVTGITHSGGFSVAVSINGRASAPASTGSPKWSDGIFYLSTTSTQITAIGNIFIPLLSDQTLTVWLSASAGVCMVYLTEA